MTLHTKSGCIFLTGKRSVDCAFGVLHIAFLDVPDHVVDRNIGSVADQYDRRRRKTEACGGQRGEERKGEDD